MSLRPDKTSSWRSNSVNFNVFDTIMYVERRSIETMDQSVPDCAFYSTLFVLCDLGSIIASKMGGELLKDVP